jgi:hypothetical protein
MYVERWSVDDEVGYAPITDYDGEWVRFEDHVSAIAKLNDWFNAALPPIAERLEGIDKKLDLNAVLVEMRKKVEGLHHREALDLARKQEREGVLEALAEWFEQQAERSEVEAYSSAMQVAASRCRDCADLDPPRSEETDHA